MGPVTGNHLGWFIRVIPSLPAVDDRDTRLNWQARERVWFSFCYILFALGVCVCVALRLGNFPFGGSIDHSENYATW